MSRYDGKTAVVTGGTSGIGLAAAKLFVADGGRALLTGRTAATIKSAQSELGPRAEVVASDTSKLADLDSLAARAKATLGKLDFVFINAGVGRFARLEEVTEAFFDELISINTRGAFFAVQKLAPLVARGGAIVFTTSIANEKGRPTSSVYAASKAALRSLTRTLAGELLPFGIRVNAVSPGPTNTPILGKLGLAPEARTAFESQMREANPMKRFAAPEEVARGALYLAFEATFTTGAELPVDGGLTQL
jgi:NAD(P)-dependent dehydrogenase (short-subunit alcohol dehydrogenase family)